MCIKTIETKKAPAAAGPYSQAIVYGNIVFCSGQIGVDPENGVLVEGIEQQAKRVLKNLKAVLEEAGSSLNQVVKTTIYLANIDDYAKMNEIYADFFGKHKPARATVEVSNLPKVCLVEIEAIAVIKPKTKNERPKTQT